MRSKSQLEEEFVFQLRAAKLPEPEREYAFHDKRKWRFDFAWVELKIAAEVQGGIWSGGAHGRGTGIRRDYQKMNTAQTMGWKVYQFCTNDIDDGSALATIESVLNSYKE